jgi:hypothetical protein
LPLPDLGLADRPQLHFEIAHPLYPARSRRPIPGDDDAWYGPGLEELVRPVRVQLKVDLRGRAIEAVPASQLLDPLRDLPSTIWIDRVGSDAQALQRAS